MCGIFGWQFADTSTVRLSAKRSLACMLAMANDSRGHHSYGFSADGDLYHATGSITRMKRATLLRMSSASSLMAHTRFATHGTVSKENCHPFTIGDVVGAHNGVISNHDALNKAYGRAHSVDSMHIFNHLADDIPLDDIQGYGAIEYYYAGVPEAINLVRFNGGELALAQGEWGCAWSSEWKALHSSLRLAGLKHIQIRCDENEVYFAQEGKLWTFHDTIKVGKSKPSSWYWKTHPLDAGGSLSEWTQRDGALLDMANGRLEH